VRRTPRLHEGTSPVRSRLAPFWDILLIAPLSWPPTRPQTNWGIAIGDIEWRPSCSAHPGSYAGGVADGGVDALAWLPELIVVHRTVAGRSYDVVIQNQPTVLTVPLDGPDATALGEPEKPRSVRAFPPPALPAAFTPKYVMHASMSLPVHEKALAVELVRLRWHDEALAASLSDIGGAQPFTDAFDSWLTTVYDWLTAWSGNIRTSIELRPKPVVRIASPDACLPG
jgi:hypothetical protein